MLTFLRLFFQRAQEAMGWYHCSCVRCSGFTCYHGYSPISFGTGIKMFYILYIQLFVKLTKSIPPPGLPVCQKPVTPYNTIGKVTRRTIHVHCLIYASFLVYINYTSCAVHVYKLTDDSTNERYNRTITKSLSKSVPAAGNVSLTNQYYAHKTVVSHKTVVFH